MTRYTSNNECQQRASKSWHREFVFFFVAIVTLWAALFIATGGYSATGPMKNAGEIVHGLNHEDSVRDSKLVFRAVEQSDDSTQLSACSGPNKNHNQLPGSCHLCCAGAWGALSASRVLSLPAHSLPTMQFVPSVTGSARSLLPQRLNRPPIKGFSA